MGEHTPKAPPRCCCCCRCSGGGSTGCCISQLQMLTHSTPEIRGLSLLQAPHCISLPYMALGFSCSPVGMKPRRADNVSQEKEVPRQQPCGPIRKPPSVSRIVLDMHHLTLQSMRYQDLISEASCPVTRGCEGIRCKPV